MSSTLAAAFEDTANVTYRHQFDRLAAGLEEAVHNYTRCTADDPQAPRLHCERYVSDHSHGISLFSAARGSEPRNSIVQIVLKNSGDSPLYARIDQEVSRTGDGSNNSTHSSRVLEGFTSINESLPAILGIPHRHPPSELVNQGTLVIAAA